MNQGIMWGVIAVIVVAAGAYFMFGRAPSAPAPEQSTQTSQPTTMRELAASGTPQKCTFTSANNTAGTVYVAGGKVRADFSAMVNGKAMGGHSIVVDNTSYVWMDGMTNGFKNSFAATTTSQTSSQSSSQGVNPDEHVTYSCEPWSADQNQFTLPQGITFSAIGAAGVQSGASAAGASCGQCDAILDASAKAQCKAALHC